MPRHRPRATGSKITDTSNLAREARAMTNGFGRLYVTVLAAVVFFVAWAVIAARPWVPENEGKQDPRLVALTAREQRLRQDAIGGARLEHRLRPCGKSRPTSSLRSRQRFPRLRS